MDCDDSAQGGAAAPQVLLYAMEDFSFADFIHLAVYHQRDIFAPSPVGMSPRTWHSDSLHPVLSTPHQQLSEAHFSSSSHKASKAARRAKIAHADTVEKAKLDAEMERLRTIKIPEMEKWAKLLQNGGPLCGATFALLKDPSCCLQCKQKLATLPKLSAATAACSMHPSAV